MQRSDSLYIDGKWRAASGGATSRHQSATEEPLGQMASASEQDVDAAIAAAQKGFEIWRKVQPWERARLIRRVGDLLREREGTSPSSHARGRQAAGAGQGRGAVRGRAVRMVCRGDQAHLRPDDRGPRRQRPHHHRLSAGRRGRGLRGLELPGRAAARKIAPALAAGCSIICRPADEAPTSSPSSCSAAMTPACRRAWSIC